MIFLSIMQVIFYFIHRSKASNCFALASNNGTLCSSCVWTHYYNGTVTPYNIGIASSYLFPTKECQMKYQSSLNMQLLILATGSNTSCLECSTKLFSVHDSLTSALIYIEDHCKAYLDCEATIYLEFANKEKPHVIIKNSNNVKNEFFRRLYINLTIQPLPCGILSATIPCTSITNYTEVVLFKFPELMLFISGNFFIKNIIWDFSDMNYLKPEEPCWLYSKCCSNTKFVTEGDICYLKDKEISGSPFTRTLGLFNIELIFDSSRNYTPSLSFNSCKFLNLYVAGYGRGFTSLIKSAGYSFFDLNIISASFENTFFPEGIVTTVCTTDELTNDPVYNSFTLISLKQLVFEKNIAISSSTLYLKDVSIIDYNKFKVKVLIKPSFSAIDSILFGLGNTGFKNIYLENVGLFNITNQTQKTSYLITLDPGNSELFVFFKDLLVYDVMSCAFLYLSSSSRMKFINITLSRWVQFSNDAIIIFNNLSSLLIEGVIFSSIISKYYKVPSLYFINCLMSQLYKIKIENSIGLSFEIYNSIDIKLDDISLNDCIYKSYLFVAESSFFSLNRVNMKFIMADDPNANIIFYFKSPLFNISAVNMNSISGQAVFDYRGAQKVNIEAFLMENNTGIRTFFLISTAFFATQISDLTIQNSVLPRFAEFLNGLSVFIGYTPVLKLVRFNLINLTLPALNADLFAAFLKMDIILRDTIFDNVKRVDMGTVAPFGIIYVSRQGSADFQNCSFKATGYTFAPRLLAAPYNYPLLLFSYSIKFSVRFCFFESDETISLNSGFLVTGYTILTAEITNCKFIVRSKEPSFAYNGITVFHSLHITFINNSFTNLSCTPYNLYSQWLRNGPISIQGEDTLSFYKNSKVLDLHNSSFENCHCENAGGLHISNYHIMNISNLYFFNNSAISGGSWSIMSSTSIFASNITILLSMADEAGSVLLLNILLMNITNYIECFVKGKYSGSWKIINSKILSVIPTVINSSSETNGGFSILYGSSFQVFSAFIYNSSTTNYGGVFFISQSSNISLNQIYTEGTYANYGGVITAEDANLITIKDCLAFKVTSYMDGAFAYFDIVYRSYIENLKIKSSETSHGIVYIKTLDEGSLHKILNLTCEHNQAEYGSCIYFRSSSGLLIDGISIIKCYGTALTVSNDLPLKISISNMVATNIENMEYLVDMFGLIADIFELSVHNSTFGKYIIFIKSCDIILTNLKIYNNTRKDSIPLICLLIKNSNISFKSLKFINIGKNLTCLMSTTISNIKINDTWIEGGNCYSAVIYLEKSPFIAESVVFKENLITCITSTRGEFSLRRVDFLKNKGGVAENNPSDILINNKIISRNNVQLENVTSSIDKPGQIHFFNNFEKLLFIYCSFNALLYDETGSDYYRGPVINDVGSCLFFYDKFQGFRASRGAGLIIRASEEFISQVKIMNSIFSNCISLEDGGGALSFFNIKDVQISNSSFQGNKALAFSENSNTLAIGGVGLIFCPPFNKRSCLISLENNSFTDNFAYWYGPLFISNSLFANNIILLNRNNTDYFSFTNASGNFPPKAFILLPDNDPPYEPIDIYAMKNLSKFDLDKFQININVKSGKPFKIEIILADNQNQTLVFDNKSTCSLENPLFTETPIMIKNGFVKASKGSFVFNDVKLMKVPATSAKLSIIIKIPKDLILNSELITLTYFVDVFFLPCIKGEIILSDFSCLICGEGKFSSIDPMFGFKPDTVSSNPQKCEICSEKAYCPGGQFDYPRPNFWRPSENSTEFLFCFIPEACLGSGNSLSRLGECTQGHYGILCNDCIHVYGKLNSNSLCENCEEIFKNAMIRLIFGVLFIFLYTIGSSYTYSIQQNDYKIDGFLIVYVKIALNFNQIVTLLTFMKFTWILPSLKKIFSTSSNSLSFLTEDVLLNDCFFQTSLTNIDNLYPLKVIVIVFLPIILGICTSLFWIIFYMVNRLKLSRENNPKRLKGARKAFYVRLFASLIISIFLFHPLILRSCFNLFNCFELYDNNSQNPEKILYIYPNFRCWSSFHYKVAIIFAVPGILIWGFLFPALLMYILSSHKDFKKHKEDKSEVIANKNEKKTLSINSKKREISLNIFKPKKMSFSQKLSFKTSLPYSTNAKKSQSPKNKTHKKKNIFYLIIKSNILEFFYYGYKADYTYWECFHFLKKLLISLLINLNQFIGIEIIVLLILFILFLSLWMQYRYQPYLHKHLNTLEVISALITFFIFMSIVVLSTQAPVSMLYIFAFFILIFYLLFSSVTALYVLKSIREVRLINRIFSYFRFWKTRRSSNS